MPARPKLQETGRSGQSPSLEARRRGAAPLLCPTVSCQAWEPMLGGAHRPLASRISRTDCCLSREVVMGTVRCRYPSPGVPLLAFHRDSEWSIGAACALSRAWQGGHGELQSRMHEDAGGTQGQRSPVYPHLSCKVQSPPAAPGWVTGRQVGSGTAGTAWHSLSAGSHTACPLPQ